VRRESALYLTDRNFEYLLKEKGTVQEGKEARSVITESFSSDGYRKPHTTMYLTTEVKLTRAAVHFEQDSEVISFVL